MKHLLQGQNVRTLYCNPIGLGRIRHLLSKVTNYYYYYKWLTYQFISNVIMRNSFLEKNIIQYLKFPKPTLGTI